MTLGANDLTCKVECKVGLWVISEKKIFITSNSIRSRVFRFYVNISIQLILMYCAIIINSI